MKKLAKAILIACLCFAVAGCGNDNAEKGELEALKQQVADLQEENEKLKQQPAEEEQIEVFENDFCTISYEAKNFEINDSSDSVSIYAKTKYDNGHSSMLICTKEVNAEFGTITAADAESFKAMAAKVLCEGILSGDDGEIEFEYYERDRGYYIYTEKETKYYAKILSLGKDVVAIACRLYPYDDNNINDTLLKAYESAQSKLADELLTETNDKEEVPEKVEEDKTASAASDEASAKEDPEDGSIPREYKSALSKAASYSKTMHMSKAGLYEQLTSEYGEQFSAEAAQYAIDNVDADWKANALEKAKSYSSTMHMSKAGLYEQLISEFGEQFTAEEAQYAVDNVNADWKANALEKAKSYQDTMNMSPEAIRDQLVSEYGERFTAEEADYAIANLN